MKILKRVLWYIYSLFCCFFRPKNSITKIYLGGTINQNPYCREWREKMKEHLRPFGVQTLSPLRGKKPEEYDSFTPGEIVDRDLMDVREADMMTAFFLDSSVGIGTSMEIMYAAERDKPIFVISPIPSIREHYWIRRFATRIFQGLDEFLAYFTSYWLGR